MTTTLVVCLLLSLALNVKFAWPRNDGRVLVEEWAYKELRDSEAQLGAELHYAQERVKELEAGPERCGKLCEEFRKFLETRKEA